MIGIVDRVSVFFAAHPKRQRALENTIAETQPEATSSKLKDLCRTRWIQRIDALRVFQTLHHSVVDCMEEICGDGPTLWSSDSLTDARSLQLAITTTDFICSLVITNACLGYLHSLTYNLQAEARDIVDAVQEINTVKATLHSARSNVEHHHALWFQKVEEICSDVGIEPALPRRCGRQIHCSNTPADTPSVYYCRTISIPLLDHLVSEMDLGFNSHQQRAILGLYVVPSILVKSTTENCSEHISILAEMYRDDLPSPECIPSEVHCWWMKWQKELSDHGEASLPTSPTQTLRHITGMYPNIRVLVSILCTLPVTSCSAERSFSTVKRIKTALRASMGTSRLTSLSLLHIHRNIPVDTSEIIDEFARRHPRRLRLANIFAEQ